MPRYTITNFSRGEFAPVLYGRVDVPQYSAGAKEITNFIVQRYGGVSFRPGFRFVGEVDDPAETYRYLPFAFSIDQAYVMVLGDNRLRLLAGGGFVAEDDLKITAVTRDETAQVTAALHDLAVGDRVYLDGIEGMLELNGTTAKVTSVVDANNFVIDTDTRYFGAFVSSTGIVRSLPPTPPPAPEPLPPDPPSPPPPPTTTSPGSDSSTTYSSGSGTYYRTRTGEQLP